MSTISKGMNKLPFEKRRQIIHMMVEGGSIRGIARVADVSPAVWYNFARINSAVRMAPAMACGLSDRLWEMDDLVRLVEAYENSPKGKL